MVSLNRPYHLKFLKGYPPQILLGPFFLNTLTQIVLAQPSIHKLLKNLTNNN